MRLDHVTLRTRDLAAHRTFFEDVFGLRRGFRPPFGFPGHWLYAGDEPLVHLIPARPDSAEMTANAEGIDHVAFLRDDYDAFRGRLDALGLGYSHMELAEIGERRLFLRAPGGALIEVAFRDRAAKSDESAARSRAPMSDDLERELAAAGANGCVGQMLVSETDRLRIWSIRLTPGERLGFHRHVLDYFWTAITDGRAASHHPDGSVTETVYRAGDTQHHAFAPGEDMIHDLTNTGTTDLLFTTVEFLDSANPPLDVAATCRRA